MKTKFVVPRHNSLGARTKQCLSWGMFSPGDWLAIIRPIKRQYVRMVILC
jgi:hypothetical protein